MVYSFGEHGPTNEDSGLTLTQFMARSNLFPKAFVWEKAETLYFVETFEVMARSNLFPNAFVWEKAETLHFVEPIEVCELKVDVYS